MPTSVVEPAWLTLKAASIYCGLCRRTLENYAKSGLIRTIHVAAPGNSRGRTIVDVSSLDSFIESCAGHTFQPKPNQCKN